MSYKKLMLAAACAITASCTGVTAALADVTVSMLHVEQNQQISGFWNDIARRYEAAHPGVKVDVQYLENEAYKKKLTTLLQSSDRPNIIYSWGGGVLRDQVKAGVIEDLTPVMDQAWKARFVPVAVQAYTINDKIYGVPMHTSQVGFFYNKDLFAKAGVDASSIKTWDDLLGAVKKFQAAGITPIITGGADKWPVHFYWSHLAIRIGGKEAFEAALRGEGKGFADTTFVQAGELFKQLADLKPFQPGFLGVTYPQSAGQFGDGKGAMMLMLNGLLGSHEGQLGRQGGHSRRQARLVSLPDGCRRQGRSERYAGRSERLAGDEGIAEGGGRLPEVLLGGGEPAAGGRAWFLHPHRDRHAGGDQASDPAPARGERGQVEVSPDLLRPGARPIGRARGQ